MLSRITIFREMRATQRLRTIQLIYQKWRKKTNIYARTWNSNELIREYFTVNFVKLMQNFWMTIQRTQIFLCQ